MAKSKEHRKRKDWELPEEYIPILSKYAHDLGLQFSCTPFYLDAVKKLVPFVDSIKIASYELLWKELLVESAKTKKPVILSTGMALMNEIESAVEAVRNAGCEDLTLLHCVSGYPTHPRDANLSTIKTLADLTR